MRTRLGATAVAATAAVLLVLTGCTTPAPTPTETTDPQAALYGTWTDPSGGETHVTIAKGGHAVAGDRCRDAYGSWFEVADGVVRLRLDPDPALYMCEVQAAWVSADTNFAAIERNTMTFFDQDGTVIATLEREAT